MTSTIKHKRANTAGKVPLVADLADGELSMNTRDAILFMKKTVGVTETVVRVGAEMSATVAAALKETTGAAFLTALGGTGSLEFIEQKSASGSEVSFTGLGSFRDVMILGVGVNTSAAAIVQLAVGNAGGELGGTAYLNALASGGSNFPLSDAVATARGFGISILNFNKTDPIKPAQMNNSRAAATSWPVGILSALAFDRLRVFPQSGTFSAGTLYALGRRG